MRKISRVAIMFAIVMAAAAGFTAASSDGFGWDERPSVQAGFGWDVIEAQSATL
ncbi:hypothetical protein [Longispora albida]|uniref:hypothetical protein n=1 Tax=Longispora albida TaxID=203523 RepID=UPI00036D862D|nr:hypothetical protein [Longispora albida]